VAPGELPLDSFLADFIPSRNESLHLSSDRSQREQSLRNMTITLIANYYDHNGSTDRVPFYWVVNSKDSTQTQEEERAMVEGEILVGQMKQSWIAADEESRQKREIGSLQFSDSTSLIVRRC
jgi:hypothetical protein